MSRRGVIGPCENLLRTQNERSGFWGVNMSVLVVVLALTLLARIAFIAFQWNHLESLWYDFEHRGFRFQLARALDGLTVTVFVVCAYLAMSNNDFRQWSLWYQSAMVFTAWLGFLLLIKLPVHRFPRTNVPGAFESAKIELIVHLVMSAIQACAISSLFALWTWFRS
jgi:hypothetical protein